MSKNVLDEETLYQLYVVEGKQQKEIAEMFNLSISSISRRVIKYGFSKKVNIDRVDLYRLYVVQGLTLKECAKIFNVHECTVSEYLKKYGIKSRDTKFKKGHIMTQEVRDKISKTTKGRTFSQETLRKIIEARRTKGEGKKRLTDCGYIDVYYPDSPSSNSNGFIAEHRLVMEKHLGRPLRKDEVVHHKNQNKLDNRIENLQVMTRSEHTKLHHQLRRNGELNYE